MNIIIFQGDLTDSLSKKEPMVRTCLQAMSKLEGNTSSPQEQSDRRDLMTQHFAQVNDKIRIDYLARLVKDIPGSPALIIIAPVFQN